VTTAIQTNGLTKDYGSGHGIFDLDLTVNESEIFGYLGPNGAGKTTTIKLLMGLIHATRGSATILGLDADRDAVALKHKIGYVPGELPQFGGWRGSEIVAYIAGLRGDVTDGEVEAVAKRLDLDLGRKYREYSHGNKQKLALLLAFAPQPALLVLDEPTSGLDPLHQQEFYGLVRDARGRGATIFISSHVLSEVSTSAIASGSCATGTSRPSGSWTSSPVSVPTASRSCSRGLHRSSAFARSRDSNRSPSKITV